MIDFQSSAIVESANHLAHRSPSAGGEGWGEGEPLAPFHGGPRQPSSLFILPILSKLLFRLPLRSYGSACHHFTWWQKFAFIRVNQPKIPKPIQGCGQFLPRLSKAAAGFFQAYPRSFRTFSKVIQAYPRLSKVIL